MTQLDNARIWTRRRRAHAYARLRAGERAVPFGASDMTPCGCVVGAHCGIPYTPIAWRAIGLRYHLRCLTCGTRWSRAILQASGAIANLILDASHPEERAARDERSVA